MRRAQVVAGLGIDDTQEVVRASHRHRLGGLRYTVRSCVIFFHRTEGVPLPAPLLMRHTAIKKGKFAVALYRVLGHARSLRSAR